MADNSSTIAHMKAAHKPIPRLPEPSRRAIEKGRLYLANRGIDIQTFEDLRDQGITEYKEDGITFLGRDFDGEIGLMETRLFEAKVDTKGKEFRHKVRGSRTFPTVIPGSKDDLAIVEGAFDGMALLEISRRQGKDTPTIIVAGGKDNRKFLENPDIQELIRGAKNIKSWGDNETVGPKDMDDLREFGDPERGAMVLAAKQAVTDKAHMDRLEAIKAVNPTAVLEYVMPGDGAHDLADWNKQVKEALRNEETAKFLGNKVSLRRKIF